MAKAARLSRRQATNARVAAVTPPHEAKSSTSLGLLATGVLLFLGALIAAFIVYAPSLNGDFVFDDRNLPMFLKNAATMSVRAWLGVRPLLMATYYLNYKASGLDRVPYHALNVALHACSAVLVFFIVARLVEWAGVEPRRRSGIALFGAAVFLLHPVQTEAVSYIASRSEVLSVCFFLAAFLVFVYRRNVAVTFGTAAIVLLLYGCAMTSKEHTAMLPAVFLLTDYFWNPGFAFSGIRRNWKLYSPVLLAAIAGALFFRSYINSGSNLGFSLQGLTWSDYLFTQFRAIFVYFRLFLLPYGQSADYAFPVSHNLLEHGAVVYAAALIALTGAAVYYRRRYPLACYGFFLTLILLAPTSSFFPIRDTLAERRMYLPFIGLILIACDAVSRLPWRDRRVVAGLAAACLLLGVLTFRRNGVWVDMDTLWRDAVAKNPENARALMGLGDAYALRGDCTAAIPWFERAIKLQTADYRHTYNLASAYDCANQLPAAFIYYQKATKLRPTSEAWVHIALIQMKDGKYDDALHALDTAQAIDPTYLLTYNYRGVLDLALSKFAAADAEFSRVLASDPANEMAQRGRDRAARQQRQF